jgi:hypothetical protein
MRAFVPGMLPSLASSELQVAYLNYPKSNKNYFSEFSQAQRQLDHNNINLIDFINGYDIARDTIGHD